MKSSLLMKKIIRHSRRPYYELFKKGFKIDVEKSIYLFTIGRGGGTWLQEIVAQNTNMFKVFEPMEGTSRHYDIYNNHRDSYENTTSENWPRVKSYLEDSFEGKVFKNHHFYFNPLTLPGRKEAILKFVNKNLLIPFFIESFDFNLPICILIRNPLEIIRSRKFYQSESVFSQEKAHGFTEEELVKKFDYFDKYHHLLGNVKTNFEYDSFRFCNEWAYLMSLKEIEDKTIFISFDDLKAFNMDKLKEFREVYNITNINRSKSASSRKLVGAGVQQSLDDDLRGRLEAIVYEFDELKNYINSK